MKTLVKEKRLKLGLSQEDLSKKANVSRDTISKLEKGEEVNITKNTMQKIAEALESKVFDIFLI